MSAYQVQSFNMDNVNLVRYAGWEGDNACIKYYFSQPVVNIISRKVSELTKGVDKKNRTIVVPDARIWEVMNTVYTNLRPAVGDIFSRYIVENNEQNNIVQSMIDQCIEIITDNIRNQLGIEEANSNLSIWSQVYGDFNTQGLRQYTTIKTLEKRPTPMLFNMNY